jgi:hypothetical protein
MPPLVTCLQDTSPVSIRTSPVCSALAIEFVSRLVPIDTCASLHKERVSHNLPVHRHQHFERSLNKVYHYLCRYNYHAWLACYQNRLHDFQAPLKTCGSGCNRCPLGVCRGLSQLAHSSSPGQSLQRTAICCCLEHRQPKECFRANSSPFWAQSSNSRHRQLSRSKTRASCR